MQLLNDTVPLVGFARKGRCFYPLQLNTLSELHTTSKHDYWVLPGGRVEFNEVSSDGIVREMKEELGIDVVVERLSYVHELIFNEADSNVHELG